MDFYKRDPNYKNLSWLPFWGKFVDEWYPSIENNEIGGLSSDMADIVLHGEGVRFPLDSRAFDSQCGFQNIQNVTIMHVSDSLLIIQLESTGFPWEQCPHYYLYSYICSDYEYCEPTVEPVDFYFDGSLTGVWEFAPVSATIIDWKTKQPIVPMAEVADENAMANYFQSILGITETDKQYALAAMRTCTYSFLPNGLCSFHDVSYNGVEEVVVDQTLRPMGINDGRISFINPSSYEIVPVSFTGFSWICAPQTSFGILDVDYQHDGIILGYQNGNKLESVAVNLVLKKYCAFIGNQWGESYLGYQNENYTEVELSGEDQSYTATLSIPSDCSDFHTYTPTLVIPNLQQEHTSETMHVTITSVNLDGNEITDYTTNEHWESGLYRQTIEGLNLNAETPVSQMTVTFTVSYSDN